MHNKQLDDFMIGTDVSLRSAMKKLDDSHRKILIVVEQGKVLYGTLTDGDIRRWILDGMSLDEPVASVCNSKPKTITPEYDLDDVKHMMLENKIQAIPVIEPDNQITDILFWDSVFDETSHFETRDKLDISVVIMAGGAGTRLDPFTRILPKPLIPIGDKSILEVIIDKFREYGIEEYYISLFNKAKIIKAPITTYRKVINIKNPLES